VFGDIDDTALPLAVLVHGFPDTPHTWRYLGPHLASIGYRVVAPWLPGYDVPTDRPVSVGTYVRRLLDVGAAHRPDDRSVLVGHDWGANAGYGVVAAAPDLFGRLVALAVPPIAVLSTGIFSYAQVKRSFYIWFLQRVGLAEAALVQPGFWESLWEDWSPGYDARDDVAELRRYVKDQNIANVICPYRAAFDDAFADTETRDEASKTLAAPPVPTLYLHGANDGALGAELLGDLAPHLPTPGSAFEIVDGVGHFLHLEQPGLIAGKIAGWLER
jgi:pimeloyl-ACP methyl ester carboxylesterase